MREGEKREGSESDKGETRERNRCGERGEGNRSRKEERKRERPVSLNYNKWDLYPKHYLPTCFHHGSVEPEFSQVIYAEIESKGRNESKGTDRQTHRTEPKKANDKSDNRLEQHSS